MTQLRRQMIEELERRNYSASTVRCYIRTVENFAQYFKSRPDRLGPEQIRQYQAHLFRDRKLAANTVAQRVAALRFFYIKTLGREWNLDRAPYPKRPPRLPNILSPQEVGRLIDAADSAFHRMIVMTLYATGVRRLELTQLEIHDIDSARMVVHVRNGKGGKDRDVMLSEELLVALRQYLRGLRRKPERWLFPGGAWHTGNYPISTSTVWNACYYAEIVPNLVEGGRAAVLKPGSLRESSKPFTTKENRREETISHSGFREATASQPQRPHPPAQPKLPTHAALG